jgi:O-antigen/teichoic acid export membrane protein
VKRKMKNSSTSLSRVIIWQMIGKFAVQGMAFLTAPIFTRLLTPSDYGYISLYASWLSLVTLFIGLDTGGATQNAKMEFKETEMNAYLSSVISISVISFVILLSIAILFSKPLSSILDLRPDLVIFLVVASFASYIVSFYTGNLDVYKEAKKSTLVSVISSFSSAVIAIVFVWLAKDNKPIVQIYSKAFPTIVFSVFFLFLIYKNGRTFYNKTYWKFCITLVFPLLFHTLGQIIFTQSDRIMLQKMRSSEELGVYSIVYTLCNVLVVIYGALNTAWLPFYFDYKKAGEYKTIQLRSQRYVNLFCVISLGFLCLSPEVFKLLAPETYWSGIKIIPIFVLAFWFNFVYLFPVNHEFYYKQTKLIPIMTVIAAVINVFMNMLFIPKYGIMGAAIGTLIAHTVSFVLHEIAARFIVKNFEYKPAFYAIPTLLVLSGCISFFLLRNYPFVRWLIAIGLTVYQVLLFKRNKAIF